MLFPLRGNLIFLEEFLHRFGFLSCGDVLYRLFYIGVVKVLVLYRQDAETSGVFELAPEILEEILEHVRIAVNFQERVAVFLVCGDSLMPPILVKF